MSSDGPLQPELPDATSDSTRAARLAVRDLLVENEKVRTQYRNMPIAMVGSIVIATLMGVALSKGVTPGRCWCGWWPSTPWTFGRFLQWRAFNRIDPKPEKHRPLAYLCHCRLVARRCHLGGGRDRHVRATGAGVPAVPGDGAPRDGLGLRIRFRLGDAVVLCLHVSPRFCRPPRSSCARTISCT